GYDFGGVLAAGLAGVVYADANDNGVPNTGEPGVGGVTVTLTGTDDQDHAVSLTAITLADGSYSFAGLRPAGAAGYTLTETQPAGYLSGRNAVGTVGGTPDDSLSTPFTDAVAGVVLRPGDAGAGYAFGELPASGLSGFVYNDRNNDGTKGPGEL